MELHSVNEHSFSLMRLDCSDSIGVVVEEDRSSNNVKPLLGT